MTIIVHFQYDPDHPDRPLMLFATEGMIPPDERLVTEDGRTVRLCETLLDSGSCRASILLMTGHSAQGVMSLKDTNVPVSAIESKTGLKLPYIESIEHFSHGSPETER